ncbi:MAG TPA: TIGR00341 family protein [Fimbriimonadaceae bacterium]|nr:TIGR00341 family protein [Fimbriimonadaceae bacterium]
MASEKSIRPRRRFGIVHGLSATERAEARQAIDEAGGPSSRFWILLLLSTLIAAFGLLTNSAAVIIGAMIIAPLMGPIVASALAIDAGDVRLLTKALTAEILGIVTAIGLSLFIGLLPINLGVTSEMLARTNPTLYDLFIAAASGLAAGYATVDRKVSSTLAGVAISVALVPPLATCGLLIAFGAYSNAWGAFLLFFANFLAIQIAAGAIFFIYRVADIHELRVGLSWSYVARFGPSLVLLVGIATFMTSTLVSLARDRSLEAGITRVLSREIGARSGGQLDKVIRRRETSKGYEVIAVALTPQPFDPAQVAIIQATLRRECRPDIYLVVRSLSSSDMDSSGQVFLSEAELTEMQQKQEEESMLSRATAVVNRHLKDVPGARLVNLLRTQGDRNLSFTAVVWTPTAIDPEQVAEIRDSMTTELKKTVRLTVRSVLTREADANRFLYEPVVAPLSASELALRQRIRDALEARLKPIEGAILKEVNVQQTGDVRSVLAVVEAPVLIRPDEVKQYEKDMRTYIDPGITLEVKTTVAGSAVAGGWSRASTPDGG